MLDSLDQRFLFNEYAIRPAFFDIEPPVFSGTDTSELFKKNLKEMPPDWHYRFKEVYYNRNSLGFRTKEIENLDKDNYFIAYGCSFTEGVGIAEDETWPYKLGQMLSMDHLNLGVGGGSPDLIHLHSIAFVSNVDHRPKFVAIQWPSRPRQITKTLKEFVPIVPQTADGFKNTMASAYEQYKWSVKSFSYIYDSYMSYMSTQSIWKAAGVPVYNWSMETDWNYHRHLVEHIYPIGEENLLKNRARDLAHFGYLFQERVAKVIRRSLLKNPKFNINQG